MKHRVASSVLEANQAMTCFLPHLWNGNIWRPTTGLLANIIKGLSDTTGDPRTSY